MDDDFGYTVQGHSRRCVIEGEETLEDGGGTQDTPAAPPGAGQNTEANT